jgi:hypothetical protein
MHSRLDIVPSFPEFLPLARYFPTFIIVILCKRLSLGLVVIAKSKVIATRTSTATGSFRGHRKQTDQLSNKSLFSILSQFWDAGCLGNDRVLYTIWDCP